MSFVGTFGTFTTARLGIYAAQKGLGITGNNIANINTTGYTRQVLDQVALKTGGSDRYRSQYDTHVGTGVLCIGTSQLRDPYLDIRYRSEMASVGSMDAKLSGLNDIAAILDEVGDGENQGDGIVEAQLSDLLTSLENLDLNAGHDEYDAQVRSSATSLCTLLNSYAKQLAEVKNNMETQLDTNVEEVNEMLDNIRELNAQIRKSEIHGDSALELRDDRNVLIDKLSEYMKIDVTYEMEDIGAGQTVEKLVIKLGNANPDATVKTDSSTLVDGIYATQLSVDKDDNYNVTLAPLVDSRGRVQITTEVERTDVDPTVTTAMDEAKDAVENGPNPKTEEDANGVKTTTTYKANTDAVYTMTVVKTVTSQVTDAAEQAVADQVLANNGNPVVEEKKGVRTETTYQKDAVTGDYTKTVVTTSQETIKEKAFNKATDGKTPDTVNTVADANAGGIDQVTTTYQEDDGQGTVTTYTKVEHPDNTTYTKKVVTETPSMEVALDDNDLYGSLQSMRELLTESGEFCSQDTLDADENAATKRGILYYQKSLDLLANQIAAQFNKLNQGYLMNTNGDYVDANGKALEYTDAATGDTVTLTSTMDLTDDQKAFLEQNGVQIDDAGVLFSNSGDGDETDGITAANISVAKGWADGVVHLVKSYTETVPGDGVPTTASDNIDRFVTLMGKKLDYNPKDVDADAHQDQVMFQGSFQEFFTNINAVLGNDIRSTNIMLDTYYSASVELDTSRESVSGVDLNDEAMNMMQYQKAYSAACRLMTTLDEALDKLINGTGTVGL